MMLVGQNRREAFIGRGAVIDQEHAPAHALVGNRLAFTAGQPDFLRGQRAHAQLIRHHLEPRQRTHAGDQHHIRHRLGKKIIRARFQTLDAIGRMIERRHHHHRQEVRFHVALETAANLEPVHIRHHHIEQHDVAFAALANLDGFRAAARGDDIKVFRRKPGFQQLHIGRNVVNNENARGHNPTPSVPNPKSAATGGLLVSGLRIRRTLANL